MKSLHSAQLSSNFVVLCFENFVATQITSSDDPRSHKEIESVLQHKFGIRVKVSAKDGVGTNKQIPIQITQPFVLFTNQIEHSLSKN